MKSGVSTVNTGSNHASPGRRLISNFSENRIANTKPSIYRAHRSNDAAGLCNLVSLWAARPERCLQPFRLEGPDILTYAGREHEHRVITIDHVQLSHVVEDPSRLVARALQDDRQILKCCLNPCVQGPNHDYAVQVVERLRPRPHKLGKSGVGLRAQAYSKRISICENKREVQSTGQAIVIDTVDPVSVFSAQANLSRGFS